LAESVVGWISPADFQELLRRNSSIALEMQRRLAGEITELRVRLAERAYLGARERLIKLLLELGEKYGCKGERGLVMRLELTERDLAGMLGNTREWVCKQLGALRERGLIAYRRGELVILDEAELRRHVTPPPCKRHALFRFWRELGSMCEVIHRESVNWFIDKGCQLRLSLIERRKVICQKSRKAGRAKGSSSHGARY
jgi:hypothetical protein